DVTPDQTMRSVMVEDLDHDGIAEVIASDGAIFSSGVVNVVL
ncbi:MAG: hypothetical protein FD149_666, partial [Rhodospirillaceae bacterium]